MPKSNKILRVLAFVLFAAAARAQTTPATEPPASVSGTVVNSLNDAPIPRARVGLMAFTNNTQSNYTAMTDGEGKFTITQLPPGNYNINIQRIGFVMPPNSLGRPNSQLHLQAGDKREGLSLKLSPTGAISGRVFNANGEPQPNCTINVEGGSGSSGSITTDEKGQYRAGGLVPGKYRILAAWNNMMLPVPPEIRTDGTEEIHLAHTWYPGVLDRKSAQRIEVAAGAEVQGIDVHLVRTPFITVSGKITGLPAGGRANVQVSRVDSPNGGMNSGGAAKPDGTFEIFRLDPGKYVISAMVYNQNGGPNGRNAQSSPVEIEVSNLDIRNVELRMLQPFDVTGQLSFDDSAARDMSQQPTRPGQQRPQSTTPRALPQRRLTIFPADPNMNFGFGNFNSQVDVAEDDSFTVERIQPGRYRISTTWGAFVKSIRVGTTDIEGSILDLRNGPPGPLTVVLTSKGAELSGVVNGSSGPAIGVRVGLSTGQSNYGQSSFYAVTDQDGAYHFSRVAPGKYRLVAGDEDLVNEIQNARDNDDYKDIVEIIDLRPGDKITKNLTRRP